MDGKPTMRTKNEVQYKISEISDVNFLTTNAYRDAYLIALKWMLDKPKEPKKKNNTEIFGEGYIAGYNQSRVDQKLMTQEEADHILKKVNTP